MEMLQLRYFFESAQNQSFTKTAQKYLVPQTSVSAAIKRLENEIGSKLFTRTSNKIVLNEKGKLLYENLEEIFAKLDSTIMQISNESFDDRVIKMLVCAIRDKITNKIIEYKTNNPNIAFKTIFDFDETDIENYHIIIDEKNDKYSAYERIELFTEDIKLHVSQNSPLLGRKLLLSDLKSEPFISVGENNGLTKILVNACKKNGFTPNFFVQGNDLKCTMKCVEAGVGIGIARTNKSSSTNSNLHFLDVVDFKETQTLCLYYKKSSAYGNVEHFINFLIKNGV